MRVLAELELEDIRQGAGVAPAVNRIRNALAAAAEDARQHETRAVADAHLTDDEHIAKLLAERDAKRARREAARVARPRPHVPIAQARRSARELESVADSIIPVTRFDPAVVGPHLTEATLTKLFRASAGIQDFLQAVIDARRRSSA